MLTAQRERDALADREARGLSRIATLADRQLMAERRVRELEALLAGVERERGQLTTLFDDSGLASAGVSDEEPSPDVLRGRRVFLYTGEQSAAAREQLEKSFYAFGAAEVTCYMTDRERGPAAFPAESIVVVDTRFMSHSDYYAIAKALRRSRASWYLTRRSASLIARSVVERWLAERA